MMLTQITQEIHTKNTGVVNNPGTPCLETFVTKIFGRSNLG